MAQTTTVVVPDIGDFQEVEVIEMLVAVGDTVAQEDGLITLESDKASIEVPAPQAGVVEGLEVKVGDRVSAGCPILRLVTDTVAAPAQEAQAASSPQPAGDAAAADTVVPDNAYRPPPVEPLPTARPGGGKPHASPSVRRYARELGVDLARLQGTGPKGRILHEDVRTYVRGELAAPQAVPSAKSGLSLPAAPSVDFAKFGPVETVALSRIKRIAGANLHRAWLNVPHVTHHDRADITELEAFRRGLQEEATRRGTRLTLLCFLMNAVIAALQRFENFNASLDSDGEHLVLKRYYHLGIAVDTPNGLVVPVIRDVERKGIWALSEELATVSAKARDGKLAPGDMQGASFTISSLGGIGGTAFTPIVNSPEVAILGVTRSVLQPVWRDDGFVPRLMLPLSLSFDHRVIDGAEAARFCAYLALLLNDVRRLLL